MSQEWRQRVMHTHPYTHLSPRPGTQPSPGFFLQIESLVRVGPPPHHQISDFWPFPACQLSRAPRVTTPRAFTSGARGYMNTGRHVIARSSSVMHLNIDSRQSEKLSCVSTPPRSGFRANCISDFIGCALSIVGADLRFGSSLLQQSFRRCAEVMHMCAKVRTRWRFRSDCTHPFFQLRVPSWTMLMPYL